MERQDQVSNQKLDTLAFYEQISGFRKLETSLRLLNIAILFVFAIVIVVFPLVYMEVSAAICPGPSFCSGGGGPPVYLVQPLFLVFMLSAILLTLIIFAGIMRNRFKKERRNIGKEASSIVSDNRQPSVLVSPGSVNGTILQDGYDLRVNLVRTWIREVAAFRDTLATLLISNPGVDRTMHQESDILQQLDRRILELEKLNKQRNGGNNGFPTWTTVANNLASIIAAIPAIVGVLISLLALLHL